MERFAVQDKRPLVAISACLLGQAVRYDGGDKRADLILETLSERVRWLAICPEVEAGLGVPRPAVRIVGSADSFRVLGVADPSLDVTDTLIRYAENKLRELSGISGCILKSRSPSCGLVSTVYGDTGEKGPGVFAAILQRSRPDLPLVEESELTTRERVMGYFERVSAYQPKPSVISRKIP